MPQVSTSPISPLQVRRHRAARALVGGLVAGSAPMAMPAIAGEPGVASDLFFMAAIESSGVRSTYCRNSGGGTFDCSLELGPFDPSDAATAQLDGQNGQDLVLLGAEGSPLRPYAQVCLQDGAAGFVCSDLPVPTNPSNFTAAVGPVRTGNLDGVGGIDLVLFSGNFPDAVQPQICLNDGAANFACSGFGPALRPIALEVADFDGQNGPDLFLRYSGFEDFMVCFNDGAAGFGTCADLDGSVTAGAAVVADVDGQNGPDVLLIQDTFTERCLNDGTGAFSCARLGPGFAGGDSFFPVGNQPAGDFDGVNGIDFAAVSTVGSNRLVCLNQGNATFGCHALDAPSLTYSDTTAVNVDGDVDVDIVLSSLNGLEQICRNDGTGGVDGFSCEGFGLLGLIVQKLVPVPPPPPPPPVSLAQPAPPALQRMCGPVSLAGQGITPGSVLKAFVATPSGPVDVIAGGLAPLTTSASSWTGMLPCPWPSAGAGFLVGEGFVGLQLVRTDLGFDASNVVGIPLIGNAAQGIPGILAVNGEMLSDSSWQPAVGVANVETPISQGASITLAGEGFASPLVNLFTATGNCGPVTPTSASVDTIQLTVPPGCVTGPGSLQVVNATGQFLTSNAVSVPVGARIAITSVGVAGNTITVNGAGFNGLTVVNFFAQGAGGVENFGGLGPGGAIILLDVVSDTQLSFQRPAGALAGAAFVEAINPPFIPSASSGTDPAGALTLP